MQSPNDGHFEAWMTVGADEIKTSSGVAKVGGDVRRIVLPGKDIIEAIKALDRKIARPAKVIERDSTLELPFE